MSILGLVGDIFEYKILPLLSVYDILNLQLALRSKFLSRARYRRFVPWALLLNPCVSNTAIVMLYLSAFGVTELDWRNVDFYRLHRSVQSVPQSKYGLDYFPFDKCASILTRSSSCLQKLSVWAGFWKENVAESLPRSLRSLTVVREPAIRVDVLTLRLFQLGDSDLTLIAKCSHLVELDIPIGENFDARMFPSILRVRLEVYSKASGCVLRGSKTLQEVEIATLVLESCVDQFMKDCNSSVKATIRQKMIRLMPFDFAAFLDEVEMSFGSWEHSKFQIECPHCLLMVQECCYNDHGTICLATRPKFDCSYKVMCWACCISLSRADYELHADQHNQLSSDFASPNRPTACGLCFNVMRVDHFRLECKSAALLCPSCRSEFSHRACLEDHLLRECNGPQRIRVIFG